MDVGMASLASAFFTSLALGIVLCASFCIGRFVMKLLLPIRGGKWAYELGIFLKVVFSTLAIILFLYATNRGVFRWFLIAGVAGAFLFSDRLFGRSVSQMGDRLAQKLHFGLRRCFMWATAPIRKATGILRRSITKHYSKLCLLARAVYDKLVSRRYDRKQRSGISRVTRVEVIGLLGGTK